MSEGNMPNFVSHYAEALNVGEPLRLPAGGTPRRDLLHVKDFAGACKAFAGSVIRHGLYNLGGGRGNALSLRELKTKLEEVSGYQTSIDEENPLPAPVPLNYVSDLTLVQQELDWKPEINLDEGLKSLF
jgi:nucleoside-diphosphate-sugar epimerase